MKYEQLIEALRGIDHRKHDEMDFFSKNIVDKARESARAAVDIWIGPDVTMAEKAAYLLIDMEDLAIIPLLEAPDTLTNTQLAWLLRVVVNAELRIRNVVVAKLDEMLDDKSNVPLPKDEEPIEEPPPPRRVCDEAYVLMRQLINFGETEETYYMNVEAFLNLSDNEKDVEIRKARDSRIWSQLIEDIYEE